MTTLIHCADLHLSAGDERDYSLSVLEEIVALTRRQGAQCLIISGDLFDSFDDARELRAPFREIIAPLAAAAPVLYVPGNHEELRRGRGELGALDLGPVTPGFGTPFQMVTAVEDVEFLCIPHQASYQGYQDWDVPAPCGRFRVAVAHGLVGGMDIYAGPESREEVAAGAIDPDLFVRFGVDYAALGHIHAVHAATFGETELRYSGSARVWRRGEEGRHGVCIVRPGSPAAVEFAPLGSAGRYREYHVPLGLEGDPQGLEPLTAEWETRDWVDVHLAGIVEDENVAARVETGIRERYGGRVRRLDIRRDEVRPLPGIASQPAARIFLEAWAAREPSEQEDERARRVWYKARELGLEQIARILEAR